MKLADLKVNHKFFKVTLRVVLQGLTGLTKGLTAEKSEAATLRGPIFSSRVLDISGRYNPFWSS